MSNRTTPLAVLLTALHVASAASAQGAPVSPAPASAQAGAHAPSDPLAPAPTRTAPDAAPHPPTGTSAAALPIHARGIDADRAVREALANNASLIAARLHEELAAQSVRAEEGRYPYVLEADAGYTRSTAPRLAQNDRISTTTSNSVIVGTGVRRTFPLGTVAELRLQGERFHSGFDQLRVQGDPLLADMAVASAASGSSSTGYTASARASVTQPLLRGAGRRVGEAELRSARVSRDVAERTRERLASELVRDVLIAYDELWYAQSALEIERSALATAQRELAETEARIAQGALPRSDQLSFAQRAAEMEEAVLSAEIARRTRALELLRLMGDIGENPPDLVAASPPVEHRIVPGRAQLERAIASGSVELAALEAELELAKTRAQVAGESSRPRLDLEGFVETQGLSEAPMHAVERAGRLQWVTAHVGAIFELPLDQRQRRAARAGALLNVRIAEQNLRAATVRVAADALSTLNELRAAEERLLLARRTLAVAREAHEAARVRFRLGQGLALEVQQREDDLRRAALRTSRAQVELAELRTGLLHLSGQLLDETRANAP